MKTFFILLLGFSAVFLALFIYSKYPVQTIFKDTYVPRLPQYQQIETYPYGQWQWEYVEESTGSKLIPSKPEKFILTLTPEGRLTSTTDCNTLSGSYVQNGNLIHIGSFIVTEKFCEHETFESSYITYLSLVSKFEILQNQTLILYLLNDSIKMIFVRK